MDTAPTLKINAQDHAITSVTVFKSSKAEIVRQFSLDLKAGQTKLEIQHLPSTLDTHSVRVSNLAPTTRLFDVVCTIRTRNTAAPYPRDSPAESIRLLAVKKQALESEKRVREHEADLLVGYAKTLHGEHVKPGEMAAFLEGFVLQGRKNLVAITEISEKIIDLDRQIEKETEQLAMKKGEAQGEVAIILGVDEPCTVNLKLTYIVSNVSWRPTYELHATTDNGKPSPALALHYRARVTQATGEDWSGTALTLSTMSSDTVARKIPRLLPVKLLPRPVFGVNKGAGGGGGFRVANNNNNNNNNNADGRQGGGLFGRPGGGLFGQNTFGQYQHQQQQQQQQAPQAFGGGGIFGNAVQSQRQSQPQTTTPFGSTLPGTFGGGGNSSTGGALPARTAFGAFGGIPYSALAPAPVPAAQTAFGASTATTTFTFADLAPEEPFEEILAPDDQPTTTAEPNLEPEPTTFVHETPVALSFSITGKTGIPSDGAEHQVEVAVLEFEGAVSYVCVPRVEARVYLQCEVKNTSEYRLLAGPVSVILDDSYVSKTSIQDVSTNDTFTCTLGDDPATKVTYSRASRTAKDEGGGAFAEAKNTTTYTTTITLHNKHAFALPEVVVREALPTCDDDKRTRVILRKPEGLADVRDGESVLVGVGAGAGAGGEKGKEEEQRVRVQWEKAEGKGGEKEGMFAWRAGVRAGEKVVLEARWEVKAPADVHWVEGLAS